MTWTVARDMTGGIAPGVGICVTYAISSPFLQENRGPRQIASKGSCLRKRCATTGFVPGPSARQTRNNPVPQGQAGSWRSGFSTAIDDMTPCSYASRVRMCCPAHGLGMGPAQGWPVRRRKRGHVRSRKRPARHCPGRTGSPPNRLPAVPGTWICPA